MGFPGKCSISISATIWTYAYFSFGRLLASRYAKDEVIRVPGVIEDWGAAPSEHPLLHFHIQMVEKVVHKDQ